MSEGAAEKLSCTSGARANKTYTYGYDAQGSVSTLLDDSTGTVKATYGYDAYGAKDTALNGR